MATEKKERKQTGTKTESLWRKPITLASFENEDPLAALYRGREASEDAASKPESIVAETKETNFKQTPKKAKKNISAKNTAPPVTESKTEFAKAADFDPSKEAIAMVPEEAGITPKMSEAELKNLLKIKSESYHFTDLREILRGKSFDIYAYLRYRAGDAGVCKIRHLDLMKELDISRPTLFKQSEWLMRLGLIEKRNVPGDHLGTSYTIHPLENVLPVSGKLAEQLNSQIENYRREEDSV